MLTAARTEVEARHDRERRTLWRARRDVHGYTASPDDIWRPQPGRDVGLVVGAGETASRLRVDASDGDADGRQVRQAAAVLSAAPIVVPLEAGVAVVGPTAAVAAVARGLVAQVLLALPPGDARVLGAAEEWMARTPHASATRGARVWLGDSGAPVPGEADIPIVRVHDGVAPPRCAAVLRLHDADRAVLEHDGMQIVVRPEPVALDRAAAVADALAARAQAVGGAPADAAPFAALAGAPTGGLRVALGSERGGLVSVDLLDDGPHAVVIGVTGSGKSELLITWVAALAARHAPTSVTFLLVDFKGGRAFDALLPLPHVVGVVTDLDDDATRRAIDSLGAEIRHRERTLAAHGARDVGELDGVLPRLVIVVDEYAAMTASHPAFHDVFADIAARGRALGMHLILATQRAAGFRDAVLANAPLRIALRVTDPADSRAVIGCIDAAALPGGPADRGTALLRRASDAEPRPLRVALCPPVEIAAIIAGLPETARRAESVRRPWLPTLPERLPLAGLRMPGRIVLGVADEPELQRQRLALLDETAAGLAVVGRSGSGRSTLLRAIAEQVAPGRLRRISADLERAWDQIDTLVDVAPGEVIVVDDLDLLVGRLPAEYAAVVGEVLERAAREARGRGIRLVVSAQRLTSATGRIVDQLPARAVLATSSRADQAAFGGDPSHHDPRLPAGRGRLDGVLVQFVDAGGAVDPAGVVAEERSSPSAANRAGSGAQPGAAGPVWMPTAPSGFAVGPGRAAREALAAWQSAGIEVVPLASETTLAAGRVVWAPADMWVGRWRSLSTGHADAELIVDAACASEVRLLTGRRDLPPYALPGARRAWLFDPDGEVHRIRLPG